MRRFILVPSLALSVVLAAGCGAGIEPTASTGPAAALTATASRAAASVAERSGRRRTGAAVRVIDSRFGRVVADGRGHVLYLFTHDERGRSRCRGACAAAWPPFITRGRPRAKGGVRRRLLGTTRRPDGRRQVTYRGQPLYFYVGDRRPGEILCQDVFEFGGTWLVVSPNGRAVRS